MEPHRMTLLPVARTRESAFAYACHGCGRCCTHKKIRVDAYAVARLAETLGVPTGEVMDRYIDADTSTLKQTEDAACVFLDDSGCGVHSGRPLACRLYPLGWFSDRATGDESFGELSPHPETDGIYSTDGTVADYLEAQGTAPYERAARRYAEVLWRLNEALELDGPDPGEPPPIYDVDAAVETDCAARDVPVPEGVEARVDLHLELLHRWLDAAGAPASSA
ncbi:MAG: hypothetical protein Rubg2KO_01160 [Rubricoccaceae bacterium]